MHWLPLGPNCKGDLLTRAGWVLDAQIVYQLTPKICKKRKLHSNPIYGPDCLKRSIISTRSYHNPNLHQQKINSYELKVSQSFSNECIFPTEWDHFFLRWRCKKHYTIILYNRTIIFFNWPICQFNLKLFFYLDVSKDDIIKVFVVF